MKFSGKNYNLEIDSNKGNVVSFVSAKGTDFIDKFGNFGAITYTENDAEDIYAERWVERVAEFPAIVLEDKLLSLNPISENKFANDLASIEYDFFDDSFDITLKADSKDFSQIGLQLDVNFIDKDQNCDYKKQLVPSFPYADYADKIKFYGFNTPEGEWLLILPKNDTDGWRIQYGMNELIHLLNGFQFLKHFDRRLKTRENDAQFSMTINVSVHNSLDEMLAYVDKTLGIVIPKIITSGAVIGSELRAFFSTNDVDVKVFDNENNEIEFKKSDNFVSFVPCKEGFYRVKTRIGENDSADAIFFAYPSWKEMLIRTTSACREPYHCDFNLCEGAMWLNATLLRLNLFGFDKGCTDRVDKFIKDNLNVTEETLSDDDFGKIIPFPHNYNGKQYSAYHGYKLERVQNNVTQALCMLELFKLKNDTKYIDLAYNYLNNVLEDHLCEDGYICCQGTDYTTVTCMIIGYVDALNLLKSRGDSRYKKFEDVVYILCEHLIKRGFCFPSEGLEGRHELEEGSISCTALTLLYVYHFLKRDERYVQEAKKFLELHDFWTMQVPDVKMYQSTLRWWETNWEGDGDGSCINAGHAWTIWKAEADFWYALAAKDFSRILKSYNGYMTNICKINPDGRMFTSYTPDYITGRPYKNKITHSYPTICDHSMPYYVWTRAVDTWFKTIAIDLRDGIIALNCIVKDMGDHYEIVPNCDNLKYVFLTGSDKPIEIISKGKYEIILCNNEPL